MTGEVTNNGRLNTAIAWDFQPRPSAKESEQRGYNRAIAEVVAKVKAARRFGPYSHDGAVWDTAFDAALSAIEAGEHKP